MGKTVTPETAIIHLKNTVKPSLGCTEPVCVALSAAAAAEVAEGEIKKIFMVVNPGLYKNGMSVAIPGYDEVGIAHAAALGVLIGKTEKSLQIFEDITSELSKKAKALIENDQVEIQVDDKQKSIYAYCKLQTEKGEAEAWIKGAHTNITLTKWNGEIEYQKEAGTCTGKDPFLEALKEMSIEEINHIVDQMKIADLQFLLDGTVPNEEIAQYGEKSPSEVGIAFMLGREMVDNSLMELMMKKVGSAIESRLDGCPYSVTSSAGAGSKGLALIIPLTTAAKKQNLSDEALARALAFGHLMNSYINAHIGKLSAMCTCAVAASTAMSAALVKLWGGDSCQIGQAVCNMTGTVTGMICDGGKTGCALKLAMATSGAYMSAKMAMNHSVLRATDGICDDTPEKCIRNIARIANQGMEPADEEILKIMTGKN